MNISFAGLGLSDSMEGNSSASMGTGEYKFMLSKDNALTTVLEGGFSGAYRYALGLESGAARSAVKLPAALPPTGKHLPLQEGSGSGEHSDASASVFEFATDASLMLEEDDGTDDQSLADITDAWTGDFPRMKSDDSPWIIPIQPMESHRIPVTGLSGTLSNSRSGAEASQDQPLSWNNATFLPIQGASDMNGDYLVQKPGQNPDGQPFERASVLSMLPLNSSSRATSLPETAFDGPANADSGIRALQGNEGVSFMGQTRYREAAPTAGVPAQKMYGENTSPLSSFVSKDIHMLPTGEQANRQHDPSPSRSAHKLAPEPALMSLAADAVKKVMDASPRREIPVAAQATGVSFALAGQNLPGGRKNIPIKATGVKQKSFHNATTQPVTLGKQQPELEPGSRFVTPAGEDSRKPGVSLGSQPGTESGMPAAVARQSSPQGGAAYTVPQAGIAPRQQEIGVPLGHEAWEQNLANQVLQAGKKQLRQLHIKLNPSHLGSLDIKLRVEGDSANIAFSSQHAAVRDAVEASLPRLREMFAATGMNLGDVDVGGQDTAHGQQQEPQDGHFTTGPMSPVMEKEDHSPISDTGRRSSKRGAGEPGLDFYA